MKEIKIKVNPKFCQQVGRVPVFNDKSASLVRTVITIPFAENFGDQHGECCGCSRPNLGNLLERPMLNTALMKAICRGEPIMLPVKLPREFYELGVKTVELKLNWEE